MSKNNPITKAVEKNCVHLKSVVSAYADPTSDLFGDTEEVNVLVLNSQLSLLDAVIGEIESYRFDENSIWVLRHILKEFKQAREELGKE